MLLYSTYVQMAAKVKMGKEYRRKKGKGIIVPFLRHFGNLNFTYYGFFCRILRLSSKAAGGKLNLLVDYKTNFYIFLSHSLAFIEWGGCWILKRRTGKKVRLYAPERKYFRARYNVGNDEKMLIYTQHLTFTICILQLKMWVVHSILNVEHFYVGRMFHRWDSH